MAIRRSKWLSLFALVACTQAFAQSTSWSISSQSTQPLATFEGALGDQLSDWKYSDNAVPVAYKGSITPTTGQYSTTGAALNFDLGCNTSVIAWQPTAACGNGATMTRKFPAGVATSATPSMSFDIRNPNASVIVELSVTDYTGQKLYYRFDPRTVETPRSDQWSHMHLPLINPYGFSGGAADGMVHGGITQISFSAGATFLLRPRDQLLVDNVTIHSDSNFSYSVNKASSLVPGTFRPSYEGRLAVSVHLNNTASFDKAKEVGITVIRKDLKWSDIERAGSMNFTNFDAWTATLAARGMSMLWILDYGHPDHGGAAPLTAPDQQAFASFAANAAAHYRGKNVVGFEIWNEPNYSKYWPSADAVSYGSLLSVSTSAIKAQDASAKVVSGGVGIDGIKALPYLLRLAQTGALRGVDAVAIHPYRTSKPETFAADATPLRNLLDANGVAAPLWVSEWGYSSYGYFPASVYGDGSDARARRYQGILTLRQVLTQLAMDLPILTLYDLIDDGSNATDREHNFGLLAPDLSDKPSMTALRTLYSYAKTRSFKGPLSDVPPVMHALRWDGASDRVFAYWVDTPGSSVSLTMPAGTVSVQRWDGSAVPFSTAPGAASVTLSESDGPVFVTLAN